MGAEQRFGQAARFEQCETQQHGVAHTGPDGPGNIAACGNTLHQDRIDPHAHHNEERLESQGKQGAKVVLPRGAPIPISHGGKGNGADRGSQVHFDHASVNDQHDADGQCVHGQAHKQGLEP